jgi:Xaa-Pro dipeptidase
VAVISKTVFFATSREFDMTHGVGGSTIESELSKIFSSREKAVAITLDEYQSRLVKVRNLMNQKSINALYLDATTSLRYFTGLSCYPSERLHGALVFADGGLTYICPAFEENKILASLVIEGDFLLWQEHESPTEKISSLLGKMAANEPFKLAIDDLTPFFTASRLQAASSRLEVVNGEAIISQCRRIKTAVELDLLRGAKQITMGVQRSTAAILEPGIDTRTVQDFLDSAHIAAGMDGRSTFKIVLFGQPTAFPHGVPYPQVLQEGDMVLIDTGATLHGYHSDITRSYVLGEPNTRQRNIWQIEKEAQVAAFSAAQPGQFCSAPDEAARKVIESAGLGPGYQVPGLPHRTGHGVGMDVHEHPYIVGGNDLELTPGMCFSIEPMICIYGEFGIRLEDHAYITDEGPEWFTEPSESIDNPLNLTV